MHRPELRIGRDVRQQHVNRRDLLAATVRDAGKAGGAECLADCEPIARERRLSGHERRIRREMQQLQEPPTKQRRYGAMESDEEVEELFAEAERAAAAAVAARKG